MLKTLSQFFAQLGAIWKKIGAGQRVTIVVVWLVIMVCIWVMVSLARRPHYGLLFANLSLEDSSKIRDILRDENIPHNWKHGGTSIYVPDEKVYEMRVMMAGKRLPRGRKGSSSILFESKSFADTELIQNIKIKKDAETEIAYTIMAMRSVDEATVLLAIPKERFIGEQPESTASVMLKLNDVLTKEQVNTVQYLVANAVPSLKVENVSVADNDGNTLSNPVDGDPMKRLTSTQLDYQRDIEQGLTEKAQSMLDKTIGPGKSVVTISAMIDFEERFEQTKEIKPIEEMESTSNKTTTGPSTGASGVPGVPAAPGTAPAAPGGGKESNETEEVIEYDVSSYTFTQRQYSRGEIKKLTVAVLIDSALENLELTQIEDLVKKAVGFVEDGGERTDEITVRKIDFYKPETTGTKTVAKGPPRGLITMIIKNGLVVVGIVVLLMFFKSMLKKTSIEAILAKSAAPTGGRGAIARRDYDEEEEEEEIELPKMERKQMLYAKELGKLAEEDPETIARVLSDWISVD